MAEELAVLLAGVLNNAAPLILAVLAECISERSGVLNLGLEGVMLLGGLASVAVALHTGSVELGALVGGLAGLLLAGLYALLVNGFKLNQIIAGVAVYMLGVSVTTMAGKVFEGRPLPPPLHIGVFNVAPLVVLAVPAAVWLLLRRTRFDEKLRAVGDDPLAADLMGVDVSLVRTVAVLINGFLAGVAGGLFVGLVARQWMSMVTHGVGWLAIALTPATLWEPLLSYIPGLIYASAVAAQYMGVFNALPPELRGAVPYAVVLAAAAVAALKARGYIPRSLGSVYVHGASE